MKKSLFLRALVSITFLLSLWGSVLAAYGQVAITTNTGITTTDNQTINVYPGQTIALTAVASSGTTVSSYRWIQNDATDVGSTGTYTPTATGYYQVVINSAQYSNHVYISFQPASVDRNYVKVDQVRSAGIKTEQTLDNSTAATRDQRITYRDGFGRPLQQIDVQAAPQTAKDIVQLYAYGAQGEQAKAYLPYTSGTDGLYKQNWSSDQYAFYTYTSPKVGRPGNGPTYAESVTDADPLGRLQEQASPGEPWKIGGGHTRHQNQRTNGTGATGVNDNVQLWSYVPATTLGSMGTLSGPTLAAANTLHVTEVTDEDAKYTISYADELGHLVCSRVYLSGTISNTSATYLETNYCYDKQGNVLAVISPKATSQLAANANSSDVLDKLCFLTVYDDLGRVLAKKTPGIGWAYSLYDRWNRLAATLDPHGATRGQWRYIKYDVLNRPIVTGIVYDYRSPNTLYTYLQNLTDTQRYEGRAEVETGYTLTQSYPLNAQDIFVSTTSYYDDYDYYPFRSQNHPGLAYQPELNNPSVATSQTRGLRTGARERVLDTDDAGNWLTSLTYYDEFARPIQTFQDNHTASTTGTPAVDRTTLHYEKGKVTQSYQTHQRYSDAGVLETHTVSVTNQYDDKGRLSYLSESIDNSANVRLVAYEYNELGQVVDKKLGYDTSTSTYLQSLDYRYNIRGWLTNINNRNLQEGWLDNTDPNEDSDAGADNFGLELKYAEADNGANHILYNGNISAAVWNSHTPKGNMRRYLYNYDNANRITKAEYGALTYQNNSYSFDGEKTDAQGQGLYTMPSITYDENGNITSLKRNGVVAAPNSAPKQYGPIDNLTYGYEGNRLQTVVDGVSTTDATNDFENNGVGSTASYTYDERGSLTYDPHKQVTIQYNYLSLPTEFDMAPNAAGYASAYILPIYSTSGRKLRSIFCKINATGNGYDIDRVVDYIGGFTYSSDAPLTLTTPVGRAVVAQVATATSSTQWALEYHIRDHQGSLRLVIRQNPQVTMFAGMEQANSPREEADFDNVATTRQFDPGHARSGNYSARLNAFQANRANGPYTSLRVNAGDSVRVEVYGHYDEAQKAGLFSSQAIVPTVSLGTSSLATPFVQDGRTASTQKTPNILLGVAVAWSKVTHLFAKREAELPQASLTYEFYDKDSTLVSTSTRYLSNEGEHNWQLLSGGGTAQKDGYVNVYLTNRSGKDVWFDDFAATAKPIATIQENHYDAFGQNLLELETTSGYDSKLQYTGKERTTDYGLEWTDYGARWYDTQLGRWHAPDEVDQYNSPYVAMGDNAVNNIDKDGNFAFLAAAVFGAFMNVGLHANDIHSFWQAIGYAATGAASGVLSAGIGGGVNSSLGGGSFGEGFVGSSLAHSTTGFIAGTLTGASVGLTNGFISETSNALLAGSSLGEALSNGLVGGYKSAILGGSIGGVISGLQSYSSGRNFWTGNANLYNISSEGLASINDDIVINKGKYTVANESGQDVYYKPEEGGYGLNNKIPSGKGITIDVDGIATSRYQDQVFKIPGKSFLRPYATVMMGGDVNLKFNIFDKSAIQIRSMTTGYQYGWMNQQQLDPSWSKLIQYSRYIQ